MLIEFTYFVTMNLSIQFAALLLNCTRPLREYSILWNCDQGFGGRYDVDIREKTYGPTETRTYDYAFCRNLLSHWATGKCALYFVIDLLKWFLWKKLLFLWKK